MPNEEDTLFLRAAVEAHALEPALADEVLAALAQVESLGASASATEIVLNRALLTPAQVDAVLASCGLKPAGEAADAARIGNFQILGRVGVGGMGVVYKARQVTMDRLVALKMLPPRLARDPGFVERFVREAHAAAALNHPNIVQIIDVGEADGLYYFAMELVEGETLGHRIRRLGRLPEKEAIEIARQIAAALEHAHAHGIIHRDVKPENILLTKKGVAKLADLGLAVQRAEPAVAQLVGPTGTPLYMSPEQARGDEAIDIRADVYSLGATLYHAVVGEPPFTGPNSAAIRAKHLYEKVPSPGDRVHGLSDGLCHVVMKMLAKRPFARYASPAQLVQDFDRLLHGRAPIRGTSRAGTGTPKTSALARRKRRRGTPATALIVAAGVVVCAVGGWVLHSALPGPAPSRLAPLHAAAAEPRPAASQGPSQEDLAHADLLRARGSAPDRTPSDAIRRFHAVASKFPNTTAAREAMAEAQAIEARLAAESHKVFDAAASQAHALAAKGKYGEAIELLDKLGEARSDLLARATEARGLLMSDAMKAERERRERANQLAEKGDFAGALALQQQIVGFGIPTLAARAKREVAILEEQKAAADRKARADAADAYEVLRGKMPPLLESRKYADARALLAAAQEKPALAPVRAEVEADLRDLDALLGVWTAAERAAHALQPGGELTVAGLRGKFVRFDQGVIEIVASKVPVKKPLAELSAKEVIALAARDTKMDEPAAQLACALLYLADGREKEAAALAERGMAAADAKRLRMLIERRRTDEREGEAEALYARAEELAAGEKWKPAAEALRSFQQQFADTRSHARHRAKAEDLALQARAATLDLADLFHGAARVVANSHRIELAYDFSSPDQLADWEIKGAQAKVEDGHLTLRGAQAFLRAPVAPDFLVTCHLTDASGPPGEWGLSLTQAPEAPPLLTLALPEKQGLQAVVRSPQRELARGFAAFRANQPRKMAIGLRARRFTVAAEGKDVLACALDAEPGTLRLGLWDKGERTVQVQDIRLSATVADNWATAETQRLRAVLTKELALRGKPWVPLFGGVTLSPWASEAGVWDVVERAATTALGGSLVLKEKPERLYDDLEFRLKIQPAKASSVVRIAFRLAKTGEHYALTLGGDPPQGNLVLNKVRRGAAGEILAQFPERVAWKAGDWHELSILAAGSELRADLDGARLFTVRDDRRHKGLFAIECPQGGAAFKDMALRSLD